MMPIRLATALLSLLLLPLPALADARVIVQYRDGDPAMKGALAADRDAALSRRIGLSLTLRGRPAPGMVALRAPGISAEQLIERLAGDPEVAFAVEDRLRDARALPNDPQYAGQWYLSSTEAAAIDAERAWDTTVGEPDIVVAVLDTGVRPEHPDLSPRLLPGYDFITEAALSGDGDGRDDDPADSGDFVDATDQANADLLAICGNLLPQQDSSWHGTRVSGVLAAAGNNSAGIAGTGWNLRILPVRVLGKCGGFDSDIIAAMRWAAGLAVPGVPANPNPARVINLSLGGSGACSQAYAAAIADVAAAGALVVASAGNETGPVEAPGNCSGVLAVAGVRHVGTKVGYSSLGTEVGISAPAGNCVNPQLPCLFPINTTSNAGSTVPAASTYTDGNSPNIGTSFSAPQVAGVAALMLSLNPALTPADLVSRIQASARPFPSDPAVPTCPATADAADIVGQCNCTTSTCGAGLLDAAAAVNAAAAPVAVITAPAKPVAGTPVLLDASASSARGTRQIVAWAWAIASAPAGASLSASDTPTTQLLSATVGSHVITLTVTDDQGSSAATSIDVVLEAPGSITPPTTTPGTGGGGGGVDLVLLAVALGAPWLCRPRRCCGR